MPRPDETCVMCGALLEGKATYTGALMFGNKSRDPHVGPYCKNCGPPKQLKTKTIEYVKDCPVTGDEWTPTTICDACDHYLGRSPFRYSDISCKHPDWTRKGTE